MAEVKPFGRSDNAFTYTLVTSDPIEEAVAVELDVDCMQPPQTPRTIVPPCTDKQALDDLCDLINQRADQIRKANITAAGSQIPPLSEQMRVEAMKLVFQIRPQLQR